MKPAQAEPGGLTPVVAHIDTTNLDLHAPTSVLRNQRFQFHIPFVLPTYLPT